MGVPSADDERAKAVSATCSSGKMVIGGGFDALDVSNRQAVLVIGSSPSADGSGWRVTGDLATTVGDSSYSLEAYAICLTVP